MMDFPYFLPQKANNFTFKRDDELNKINEIFTVSNNCNLLTICGDSGTGKSVLALQYALSTQSKYVRWFNAALFEIEYKDFAQEFLGEDAIENKSLDFIIEAVNAKLKLIDKTILFIFDNLNEHNYLDKYLSGLKDLNLNTLITTRNTDIPIDKIFLDNFNTDQALKFLNEVKVFSLNEDLKNAILHRNEILNPLRLRNLIYFVKEFSLDPLDLNNIYEYLEIHAYSTFCLLQYCSILEPNYISISFLNDLLKANTIINLKKEINKLNRLALIETFYSDQGINAIKLNESTRNDVLAYKKIEPYLIDEITTCLNKLFESVNEDKCNWKSNRGYFVQASHVIKHDYFKNINKDVMVSLLTKLASYELNANLNLEKSLEYNLKVYEILKGSIINDDDDNNEISKLKISDTLSKIANTYAQLETYEKSLEYALECYEIRKNLFEITRNSEIQNIIIDSLNNLAELYEKLGNLDKSLEYYKTCLKIQTILSEKNHIRIANNLTIIALIYSKKGDNSKSLEYKLQAYEISKKFNLDRVDIANSLYSIGVSYEAMNMHDKSLEFFFKSYELRKCIYENQDNLLLADSLFSLANAYSYMGDFKKSLEYDLKCLEMRKNIYGKEHEHISDSLYNIAITYRKLGDTIMSLNCFLDCYDLKVKILNLDEEKKESHPDLIKINKIINFLKKHSN